MNERNVPATVFLSYASENEDVAERLERDLRRHGITPWRAKNKIASGADWEEQIREVIRSSSAVVCLASFHARTSKVVRGELQVTKMYGKRIRFAWIAGDTWADCVPIEYIYMQYTDMRGQQYPVGLHRLIADLEAPAQIAAPEAAPRPPNHDDQRDPNEGEVTIPMDDIDPDITHPRIRTLGRALNFIARLLQGPHREHLPTESDNALSQQLRNPYKGLRAFTTDEKDDFFGREDLVEKMVEEIRHILTIERQPDHPQEPRFLTIVGPSGSGKSSVAMAGLLPRLQQGNVSGKNDSWTILPPMKPGKEPLEALAQTLLPQLQQVDMGTLLAELRDNSTRALHRRASEIARQPEERVVLLIDQFEELFTETTDEKQRGQFIDVLTAAATESANKVLVIATLRADFSDHPMKYPPLHRAIEAHRIPIPPMTIENLRAVIECPAKLPDVQASFEENLIGDLLLDIHGQEENLPLLQFTLEKLFEKRNPESNLLTFQAYEAIGKVHGALGKHAEDTYLRLSSDEYRALAKDLFTQLINPGDLEQDATRRRVRMSDFVYTDATRNRQMQGAIEHFIHARLITTNEVDTHRPGRVSIIEISHEALISAWTRLNDWITSEKESMAIRQELDNNIQQWKREQKHKSRLYSGYQLARAAALAERIPLNGGEEEFLNASKGYERQKRVWSFFAAVGVALLVILVAGAGVAAGVLYAASLPSSTTVTTLQERGPGSLSQVIHDAKSGSTLTFASSLNGTIRLDRSDLDIDKDITLSGPENRQISISNGKSASGHKIHVHTDAKVTFENLRFSNSLVQQTAFIDNEGNLTLANCTVDHNASSYNGGGIYSSYGSLALINSDVHDNTALGNGGGIYIWQSTLKIDRSNVSHNGAQSNGAGIYTLNSGATISNSKISDNQTTGRNATSNGGGMSILGGVLVLDSSKLTGNETQGYGGGLALLGSNGFISKSVIMQNHADRKGGGLAVEENSENGNLGLAVITNIEVTSNPQGSYWIGNNDARSDADILGKYQLISSSPLIVKADTSEVTGNPAPRYPPEKSKQYLGTANLDAYCRAQYLQGTPKLEITTSEDTSCDLVDGGRVILHNHIDVQKVCQWQYHQPDGVNRLADYFDPSSWQCYVHVQKLGGITNYLDGFCKYEHYKGVTRNTNGTAYDWNCLDKNGVQVGLSVADACQWYYRRNDAFDRLINFNDPRGWECWAPKSS